MASTTVTAKTVLVADDTAFVRDRFRAALESAGHKAIVVKSAAELLARIKADLARRLTRLRGCAGAVCRQGPELRVVSKSKRGRNCRRSRLLFTLRGPSTGRVSTTSFYLDGHLLKRDRRTPFTAIVPKRIVHPMGSVLDVFATLSDSRRQTIQRRLAGCL